MEKRGISAESQRNEKSMENMILSFRELVNQLTNCFAVRGTSTDAKAWKKNVMTKVSGKQVGI